MRAKPLARERVITLCVLDAQGRGVIVGERVATPAGKAVTATDEPTVDFAWTFHVPVMDGLRTPTCVMTQIHSAGSLAARVARRALYARGYMEAVRGRRGFILPELGPRGYQAGAIRIAEQTNITLTSLADLRENSEEERASLQRQAYIAHIATLGRRLSRLGHGRRFRL